MDFIGNYHNNVNIPKKYYSKEQFENLLKDNNLFVKKRITNVRYHSRIFFFSFKFSFSFHLYYLKNSFLFKFINRYSESFQFTRILLLKY